MPYVSIVAECQHPGPGHRCWHQVPGPESGRRSDIPILRNLREGVEFQEPGRQFGGLGVIHAMAIICVLGGPCALRVPGEAMDKQNATQSVGMGQRGRAVKAHSKDGQSGVKRTVSPVLGIGLSQYFPTPSCIAAIRATETEYVL